MKKRLLVVLLVLITSLACSVGLVACGFFQNSDDNSQVTITLKANGGTFTDGRTIATVTVDENASIDGLVPLPVRDGYVFDGWSNSQNGTEIVDLTKTQFNTNTELYAVWVEKVVVTYFANGGSFADEEYITVVEQKKGAAAKLPIEPERDNYVFAGWYKGTLEDGKVTLAESFNADVAVNEDIDIYAKWVLEKGARLPKPADLKVESDKISWSAVDGAAGYLVYVLDGEKEQLEKKTVTSNVFTYDFSYRGEGTYTIRVCAKGDGVNYTNSEYATKSYSYGLSSLDISFDAASSTLYWEAADQSLPAATSYDIKIYGAEAAGVPVFAKEDIVATSFDMSFLDAGAYTATVFSYKQNFTPVTTSLVLTKLRLATPDVNVSAEETDGEITKVVLSWNAVKYATVYYVTVGSLTVSTSSTTYTINNGTLNGGSSVFDFKCAEGTVAVRAYDEDCDYLVSLPNEKALNTSALVKVKASAEDANGNVSSVTVNGSLYIYNEAPFKVYFDYLTNLYLRYPEVKSKQILYDYNLGSNKRIGANSKERFVVPQEVTATSGVQYPEDYRATLTPNANYVPAINTYVSCGWFTDPTCTIPFDFTATVTKNVTVYAGWVDLGESLNDLQVYRQNSSNGADAYKADGVGYSDFNRKYKVIDSYSDTEAKSVYFTTRVAHQYDLKYRNTQSGTNTITITNLTDGTTVNTISVTGTSQNVYRFNGKVGDVFKITFSHTSGESALEWEMWHDNESNRTLSLPSGGKAGASNWGNLSETTAKEIYAVNGTVVTLTVIPKEGKTFLGWFDKDGNKVSEELVYVFTATADIEYTAKWA